MGSKARAKRRTFAASNLNDFRAVRAQQKNKLVTNVEFKSQRLSHFIELKRWTWKTTSGDSFFTMQFEPPDEPLPKIPIQFSNWNFSKIGNWHKTNWTQLHSVGFSWTFFQLISSCFWAKVRRLAQA